MEEDKPQIDLDRTEVEGKSDEPVSSSVHQLLSLNDHDLETIYGQAYHYYNTGKYDEGLKLFMLLSTLDSSEPKYALGVAACYQMLKDYQMAVQSYMLCSALEPHSPIPYYYASECSLLMGDKFSAIINLQMVAKCAEGREEHRPLRDRALMAIKKLKGELTAPKEL